MHDAQPASASTTTETAEMHDAQPQLQRLQRPASAPTAAELFAEVASAQDYAMHDAQPVSASTTNT